MYKCINTFRIMKITDITCTLIKEVIPIESHKKDSAFDRGQYEPTSSRGISRKSVISPVENPPTERHVHTQPDPLSADLIFLFDNLEQQHLQRSSVYNK